MKLIWKALGFLAVLLVIAVMGIAFLPADRLGKIASDQLSRQLDRPVVLSDATLSIWPVLGLQAGGLQIGNPDWAGPEPMFTAQSAGIGLDAMAAIRGRIEIKSLTAASPTLRLISDGSGKANWDFSADQGSAEQSSGIPSFTLDRLSITNGTFVFQSPDGTTRVDDTDLTLRWPDMNGPMLISANLDPGNGSIAVTANIQRPLAALFGGAGPVDATLKAGGGTIGFDGLAGPAPEAKGTLTLDLPQTAQTAAVMGQIGVDLPEGLGRSLSGTLAVTLTRDGLLAIRDANLQLDGNAIEAAADIKLATKPHVNAQIRAKALDLSGLTGTSQDAPASDGWSDAPIDASGLAAFDGEIALISDALTVGDLSFGKTRALMSVDNSRAVFELRELSGYDGVMTGSFVANNRSGLSVRADLAFGGVALQPILRDAMGLERMEGPADGSLSLLGSGQSTAAIMASLSGDGALRAGPGRINGIDLDQVLSGQAAGGTTIFEQATGTFTIKSGVMRNDDLFMDMPVFQAKGEGRMNLGKRSLDYLLTVFAPNARDGRGLAVPVRVKGPWTGPAINVDLGAAIEQNFAEERKQLEEKARAKVNDALEERLGVTVEEGENLQDVLQNKLEEEAKKGLLNLLDK